MSILKQPSFFQRIILPAFLTILLFIIAVFGFIIPAFEKNAMVQKQTMLNELTNTAWSVLQKHHTDYLAGLLSLEEAQQKAKTELEALRYGKDKKDYFWLTDMTPHMVMHPYVHELNGKSLVEFTDSDGKKLFVEAVHLAQTQGEGFIQYKWQHKDDSLHIVSKLSFVKGFAPWQWIIGTGVYLDDVEQEISALTNTLILILIGIIAIISCIIFFITYQSLAIEHKRRLAESQLLESKEKYKSLVESSTEGIVLWINNEIAYSNSFIQHWLGYSGQELAQLHLTDFISSGAELDFSPHAEEQKKEISLQKKEGTTTTAILTILPIRFVDKEGVLCTFKDSGEHAHIKQEIKEVKHLLELITQEHHIGLIQWNEENSIAYANPTFLALTGYANLEDIQTMSYEELRADHHKIKHKEGHHIPIDLHEFPPLSKGQYPLTYGIIQLQKNTSNQLSPLMKEWMSSLSVNQPTLEATRKEKVTCQHQVSIKNALAIMQQQASDAILVQHQEESLGLISLTAVLERILLEQLAPDTLVKELMTSPIPRISIHSSPTMALSMFNQLNVKHLAVTNDAQEILWLISKQDLTEYIDFTWSGLAHVIQQKSSSKELKTLREQLPRVITPFTDNVSPIYYAQQVLSDTNDLITKKIIEQAIQELGTPPTAFAFVCLGSAARKELHLRSDQDNALIYHPTNDVPKEEQTWYFEKLATYVCQHLNESGLALCEGNYMASNPKWCQPIEVWKNYFTTWITEAEPENILHISVFFDMRFVYGSSSLVDELHLHINDTMKGRTAFFYFLAQGAIQFKPPIHLFGQLLGDASHKKAEGLDIKTAITSVVMYVRIYALYHGIKEMHTLERIEKLKELNVFSPTTYDEIRQQYIFLAQLKLHQQITLSQGDTTSFDVKKLKETDQLILKKIIAQLQSYPERLAATFMSAYKGV